jgi:predicted Zn-dependent protease
MTKQTRQYLLVILSALGFIFAHLLFLGVAPAQTLPLTPEQQTLSEADKLYLLGKRNEAEQLYRQVKAPFEVSATQPSSPILDSNQLSPASQVYWQNIQEGLQQNSESKLFTGLNLLIEAQPEFVPAYLLLADALQARDRSDEALSILEKAVTLFPDSVDLTKKQIEALENRHKWLEASIAARQFTIVYPDHPAVQEFQEVAEQDLKRFKQSITIQRVGGGILGSMIGLITGDSGASALNLGALLIEGESRMGERLAEQYYSTHTIINDPAIDDYVSSLGQDLAKLMGRKFDYKFYVVQDDGLNSFSLPGGKIFVNSGAILKAQSEAEFAGLLSHEIAHAALSHGFQSVVTSHLITNITQQIPYGNIINAIASVQYSQFQERQSDLIGTRVISTAGYASDGLRNVLEIVQKQDMSGVGNQNFLTSYLSTHPAPISRLRYLENLIQRNGYNRYAYEGIEKHVAIQNRLRVPS